MKTLLIAILAIFTFLGCSDATVQDEIGDAEFDQFAGGKADNAFGVANDSYLAAGVLELVNRATEEELDDRVPLNARAARNIVETRNADGPFQTLEQLDDVSYVGPSAFRALAEYAQQNGYVGFCGDGNVQTIEACDDGNTDNNDGCSSTCEGEGNNPPIGPNGPPYEQRPTVHGIMDGSYEGVAILKIANTASLAVLDNEVGLDIRAAKNIYYDRGNGYRDLVELDAISYVGASAFRRLLEYALTTGQVPSCGDGEVQPVMEICDDGNLTDRDGCDSHCRLESVCGDGLIEYFETCDDGNADSLDGCSASCEIETLSEGVEHQNRTREQAREIGTYRHLRGTIRSEGDIDYWTFTINQPSEVSIDIWGGSPNGACRGFGHAGPHYGRGYSLFNPKSLLENESGQLVDDINENCGSMRSSRNGAWDETYQLAPGTYFIKLVGQDIGNGWDAPYTVGYAIELEITPNGPICGNGVVDSGELCDDGNSTSLDGCSSACDVEFFAEQESNNTVAQNNAIGTYTFVQGDIGTGDKDVYGFRITQRSTVFVSTVNGFSDCPFDGHLAIYDSNSVRLADDDDSAGNYCPEISRTLDPGTYFVELRHARNDVSGGEYTLEISRD